MKVFKNNLVKRIEKFNLYIRYETEKEYTENKTEPVTKIVVKKKNTKPDTKPDYDLVTNYEIKTYIIDKKTNKKQILLETKKTIRNNIYSIYNALKKLPKESQPKLIELVRLDTMLNDSINLWLEIYERDKKMIKKIDVNKIKNVEGFICQLKGIINHAILLLKTSVIVKLNLIINDIKNKSNIDDVYNYNDTDKLFMISNDLDKYMKILKKDIRNIKQNLKTISAYQTDSHQTLMKFLK